MQTRPSAATRRPSVDAITFIALHSSMCSRIGLRCTARCLADGASWTRTEFLAIAQTMQRRRYERTLRHSWSDAACGADAANVRRPCACRVIPPDAPTSPKPRACACAGRPIRSGESTQVGCRILATGEALERCFEDFRAAERARTAVDSPLLRQPGQHPCPRFPCALFVPLVRRTWHGSWRWACEQVRAFDPAPPISLDLCAEFAAETRARCALPRANARAGRKERVQRADLPLLAATRKAPLFPPGVVFWRSERLLSEWP